MQQCELQYIFINGQKFGIEYEIATTTTSKYNQNINKVEMGNERKTTTITKKKP